MGKYISKFIITYIIYEKNIITLINVRINRKIMLNNKLTKW
jgi:hypothetical protein